mgnify:CR=1 FL=1
MPLSIYIQTVDLLTPIHPMFKAWAFLLIAAGFEAAWTYSLKKVSLNSIKFAITENPDIPLDVLNIFDLERLAKERLPVLAYDYYRSGAWDETTLKANREAYEKLKILGIENEALKMPNQLSGGQKQRVAIARALINDPLLIMGDEPTGNLDKKNSEIVFDIFKELAEEFKQTLLIVTHDNEFAARTTRIIEMEDGQIIRM